MAGAPLSANVELGVSDFIALVNQTLEYAYSGVTIRGELANFKISKNKWIYFDLKDEGSVVRFFGTVYQLSGPLEDGMVLIIQGTPRMHPRFGFSVSVHNIRPSGEGSIRRSAELLQASLASEGIFDVSRKRPLPYPPERVGLITSVESAAYADFTKILDMRWRGIAVECIDVQVQGEGAPLQIVSAIETFNRMADPPEVLVLVRGGGSAEDLHAFNTESVTRVVAASRVPTLVAIGHEIDVSLAELAADRRASTPSNAAELLVPDRRDIGHRLALARTHMHESAMGSLHAAQDNLLHSIQFMEWLLGERLERSDHDISAARRLLQALDPRAILKRGYGIVRLEGAGVIRGVRDIHPGAIVDIEVNDGSFMAAVRETKGHGYD